MPPLPLRSGGAAYRIFEPAPVKHIQELLRAGGVRTVQPTHHRTGMVLKKTPDQIVLISDAVRPLFSVREKQPRRLNSPGTQNECLSLYHGLAPLKGLHFNLCDSLATRFQQNIRHIRVQQQRAMLRVANGG